MLTELNKYPDGPPGSERYEWRWATSDPNANRNLVLFTRLLFIYMVIFALVTFVQVVAEPFFDVREYTEKQREVSREEDTVKQSKPRVHFEFINEPPTYTEPWRDVVSSYPSSDFIETTYAPVVEPAHSLDAPQLPAN
ncbi:unnamed protein product [Strongylus vulgaris]|uniref:Uncharacterized protein n=1 Tax=Strongylus vulgaris TaxID=40348 RepID=A0A3P7IK44_STRVU|nr:unnamed protein product [Strongylus vulgaris]